MPSGVVDVVPVEVGSAPAPTSPARGTPLDGWPCRGLPPPPLMRAGHRGPAQRLASAAQVGGGDTHPRSDQVHVGAVVGGGSPTCRRCPTGRSPPRPPGPAVEVGQGRHRDDLVVGGRDDAAALAEAFPAATASSPPPPPSGRPRRAERRRWRSRPAGLRAAAAQAHVGHLDPGRVARHRVHPTERLDQAPAPGVQHADRPQPRPRGDPTTPVPLSRAAAMPATWVPWPLPSL